MTNKTRQLVLTGYEPVNIHIDQRIKIREIIQLGLMLHNISIDHQEIFSLRLLNDNEIYEIDDAIDISIKQECIFEIVPRYFDRNGLQNYNLVLLYCIYSYCFNQYITNTWNYTEINIITLNVMLRDIYNNKNTVNIELNKQQVSIVSEDLLKKYCGQLKPRRVTENIYKLLDYIPERQKSMFKRIQFFISRIEHYYFNEYKQLNLDKKIEQCVDYFVKYSGYSMFYFYPILDIDNDWTSQIGIAEDGIVLMDSEMSLAYMYLSFLMISQVSTIDYHNTITIYPNEQQLYTQGQYSTQQTTQKKNLLQHITHNIPIPIYPKIHNNLNNSISKTIEKQKDYLLEAEVDTLLDQSEVKSNQITYKNLRKQIKIKFQNQKMLENFMKTYIKCKQQYIRLSEENYQFIKRNIKIQSKLASELFLNLWLNNSLKFCSLQSDDLLQHLEEIHENYYFKNNKQLQDNCKITQIICRNIEMHHQAVRAILLSLTKVYDYIADQTHNCILVQVHNNMKQYFTCGDGNAYDTFLPINHKIVNNIDIQLIVFNNNKFEKNQYLFEFYDLFKQQRFQQSLVSLKITQNLIKRQGMMMLGKYLNKFIMLQECDFNESEVTVIGLCSFLYLLDQNQVYLKKLYVNTIKFYSNNQIEQLGWYIIHSFHKNGVFDELDLSGCHDQPLMLGRLCKLLQNHMVVIKRFVVKECHEAVQRSVFLVSQDSIFE